MLHALVMIVRHFDKFCPAFIMIKVEFAAPGQSPALRSTADPG
jgi:hypothetical protein